MTDSEKKMTPLILLAVTGLYALIMIFLYLIKYKQYAPGNGIIIPGILIINLLAPCVSLIFLTNKDKHVIFILLGMLTIAILGTILLFIGLNIKTSNYFAAHQGQEELKDCYWFYGFFGSGLGANAFMIIPVVREQKPNKKIGSPVIRFIRYAIYFVIGLIPSALVQFIYMPAGSPTSIIVGIIYPIACYFLVGFLASFVLTSMGYKPRR